MKPRSTDSVTNWIQVPMGYFNNHGISDPGVALTFRRFTDEAKAELTAHDIDEIFRARLPGARQAGPDIVIRLLGTPGSLILLVNGEPTSDKIEAGISEVPWSHFSRLLEELMEIQNGIGARSDWEVAVSSEEHILDVLEEAAQSASREVKEWVVRNKTPQVSR